MFSDEIGKINLLVSPVWMGRQLVCFWPFGQLGSGWDCTVPDPVSETHGGSSSIG